MSNRNKFNPKQRGIIGLVVMAVLSVAIIFASEFLKNQEKTAVTLVDGFYKVEASDFGGSGYKDMVSMKVAGGAITAVTWDLVNEAGEYKSQLSIDGKYIMTESNPRWHEQAEMLVAYVIENQSVDGLKMDENGKTDVIASVSIDISAFVSFVSECMEKAAKGETSPVETGAVTSVLKDGSYKVEASEFENGYKDIVTMEVAGGAITAVTWDLINEAGEYKSQLSMDGKYIMTESNPRWHEQAEMLAAYVIENQSVDGLTMDENGKTDVIASVSIDISAFVSLASECLEKAAKGETSPAETGAATSALKDGTYTAETSGVDAMGYKDLLSMEVAGGAITSITWDLINEAGEYKSQLSMDGKYIMTESNPRWHEQAEMLAAYVIENQSYEGLTMDSDGKTDVVSSVSIDISEFVNLLSNCMAEAKK